MLAHSFSSFYPPVGAGVFFYRCSGRFSQSGLVCRAACFVFFLLIAFGFGFLVEAWFGVL